MIILSPQPLTKENFAEFGEVIETRNRSSFLINNGSTERFHQLANVEVGAQGSAIISIFKAQALELPLPIRMLEKHPLGSQAFIPLMGKAFLIVVAPKGEAVHPEQIQAFISNGSQGINYYANTWHHPIIALDDDDEFLVVDRSGPGNNCDEFHFDQQQTILLYP